MKVFFDFGGSDGSPGTAHNVTDNGSNKIRFKTADDADIDVNNPIPVPTTGYNYSYWKHIYLKCTDDTGLTQIDNVKFYSDGGNSFGTGIGLMVGSQTPTNNSGSNAGYDDAGGTEGSTGSAITTHGSVSANDSVFGFTSGSPKDVSISESGSIIDATNEKTDYIILQLSVASTASGGALTAETLTFSYDEV